MTDQPASEEVDEVEDESAETFTEQEADSLLDTDTASAEYVDAPNGTEEATPWSSPQE